ncbi:vitamin K-dependent gamma-carboxylase [Musca domestica]|uniref:Vitamin K-dependent gamma-carboxylase n=1 Tax=Musca domestica TaxID=7370 RepID=A0A9J7DB16_MUSDO|nr:vitamin K-dependent gamma-carboxylase [Musca domestica]
MESEKEKTLDTLKTASEILGNSNETEHQLETKTESEDPETVKDSKETQKETTIKQCKKSKEASIKPRIKQLVSEKEVNNSAVERIFKYLTDYEVETFQTYGNFRKWLQRPVDAATLGVFRMFYGAAMLIDMAEERGGGNLDVRFGEPLHCHFPLFDSIQVFSFPIMGCIYLCMWLGAIGIMLGYRFRLSCLAFVIPYWYIFLLDKPAWNNHSYLFGLVGILLLFSQANRYCSLDKYLNPAMPSTVPYWNYFLIKFQFFLLYMYAGMKKLTAEWLSGYAMSSLSRHWVLSPFRWILSEDLADLLIVHWFTAIFDFSIAFFMTCSKTRLLATPFMVSFHLMNSRLFVIGMFPWVCLAQVPMFFGFDWPRKLNRENFNKFYKKLMKKDKLQNEDEKKAKMNGSQKATNQIQEIKDKSENPIFYCKGCQKQLNINNKCNKTEYLQTFFVLFYCALQLFLPYSHFITKGYNNWTNGLYGYSWDMMVHSYNTIMTTIKVVDNSNNKTHYLNPYAFTEYDRWMKYADMAQQYAKCIKRNIDYEHQRNPRGSPLSSTNISIYIDVWCSMNGRFQQRVFDPRVDLLTADWSVFKRTPWSLPLLTELNHMRPRLRNIADDVLSWNNYSDVMFVADFPGLTLDHFISPDLTNVSLTILEGHVRYKSESDNESYFLTAGKSIGLPVGVMHHITTIGMKPSCYLYTYVNKTMEQENIIIDNTTKEKPLLPLWQEFKTRVENYKRFLQHMGNCILYLLYGVPIPMKIRDKD